MAIEDTYTYHPGLPVEYSLWRLSQEVDAVRMIGSDTAALLRKIKASMQQAVGNNSVECRPLVQSAAWTARTYFQGEVVSNAGNDYMALVDNAASTTAPTGTSTQRIVDGSQQWVYYGPTADVDPREGAITVVNQTFATYNATLTKRYAASLSAQGKTMFFSGGPLAVKSDGVDMPTIPRRTGTSIMSDTSKDNNIGCIDLHTDADQIAFGSASFGANGFYKFSAEVNVRALQRGGLSTLSGVDDGWVFTFPSAKERRIRMWHSLGLYFPGVYVKPQHTVWAPQNPNRWRLVTNMCSHQNAALGFVANGGVWSQVARILGCDDYVDMSSSGTGFLNDFANQRFPYGGRLAAAIAQQPDIYITGDNFNDSDAADGGTSGVANPLLQSTIVDHLTTARAGMPGKIIILIGTNAGKTGNITPGSEKYVLEQDALAAYNTYKAANPGDTLTFYLPCIADPAGSMMYGTRDISQTQSGTDNSNIYTMTGDIHAWQGGMDYQARWWATRMRGLLGVIFSSNNI